jgi:hypothetical protein
MRAKNTLSVREAAELAGVPTWTLYRATGGNALPLSVAFRVGRRVFIRRSPFIRWIRSGGSRVTSQSPDRAGAVIPKGLGWGSEPAASA